MNPPSTKPEFLLLLRGTQLAHRLPANEAQEAMARFTDWFERFAREGKIKAGQPLEHEGKIIVGKGNRSTMDGPFAESKEAVGGYVILEVESLEEAIRIGELCPLLDYGSAVEVRPLKGRCATLTEVKERLSRTPSVIAAV